MLAACLIQYLVWRRAIASWHGVVLRTCTPWRGCPGSRIWSRTASRWWSARLHGGSSEAGWTAAAATLLALTLLMILAAQVLGGVQFLRPSGPPGTLPAHMRRLIQRAQPRAYRRATMPSAAADGVSRC